MTTSPDLPTLIDIAISCLDDPGQSLSSSVRRAHRIAALRQDLENLMWLQWEMTEIAPYRTTKWQDPGVTRVKQQIEALLGAEEGRKSELAGYFMWERNRTIEVDGEPMIVAQSVAQIESELRDFRAAYSELTVPTNLSATDAYTTMKQVERERLGFIPLLHRHEDLLERVRTAVYGFLVESEKEIRQGQREATIFGRGRAYVDAELGKVAPDALRKFLSAQERLDSGDPEAPAHALTSCRRTLKALADALYPATGETIRGVDGVEREMSNDAYRNRLIQFIQERMGSHARTRVMTETLAALGTRIKALDSLASKGVHNEATVAEAETCVVWTYFLAGDLFRLNDGTSAVFVEVPDA